jgi:N,N-dimethylformamidase
MAEIKVFGYASRLTVKPGDSLSFHVTADGTTTAAAQLVRLIHGDMHPAGPGYIEEEIKSSVDGPWAVKKQYTQVGNYLTVADPEGKLRLDGSFTLCAYVYPALPGGGVRQSLMGRWDVYNVKGYGLSIGPEGHLNFGFGDGKDNDYLNAEVPLLRNTWYFVAASYDANTKKATIYQEAVINRYNSLLGHVVPIDYRSHVAERMRFKALSDAETPFLIGGARDWHQLRGAFVAQTFSGKIDRPMVFDRALTRTELDQVKTTARPPSSGLAAFWDTTAGYTDAGISDEVIDVGPHKLHAKGVNRPVRAQTGHNWKGRNDCFRLAPDEYGGIEFHSDAVMDCGWEPAKSWTVPDLKSGIYAIRLRAGKGMGLGEEYIVFFVTPKTPRAKIAFLAPTASYLAYANEHLSLDAQMAQPIAGQPPIVTEVDIELYQTKDFGLSTYDHHNDDAGVCYTSSRRPILNMRPKARLSSMGITWQFAADLSITAWLEKMGYDFEVITDETLHAEGLAALKPYTLVISGSHPEYYSEEMLDATEDYIAGGGRYIYMGGNGYYWNVAFRDGEPWIMETRKLDSGMRAWNARPGEHYLCTTGMKGGLWRNLGRPPQKTVGVGFISQGFESARPYRRMPDSWHRRAGWMFKGIEGEVFGDFGLAHEGAAGLELDRYDLSLGTPPHTLIVASSGGHSDNYMLVYEEVLYAFPGMTGTFDYRIRADITYFTSPSNGACLSTGSIAFGQSLPYNNFDNNISKFLKNVVDAFAKPGKLPGWAWTAEEKQWR